MSAVAPYQMMPPLPDEEYEALKADIAKRGLLVPIEVDENKQVLDGHHRLRALAELGITDYESRITTGFGDDDDKIEHALTLNLSRRQLSKEERKEIAIRLRGERKWTLQRIADALGVTEPTILNWCGKSTFKNLKVEGEDGKFRPMSYRPRTVAVTDVKQLEKALALLETVVPEKRVSTMSDLWAADHERRRRKREEAFKKDTQAATIKPVLIKSEYRTWLSGIAPDCDLLLTDPPYSTDVEDIQGFAHDWLPLGLSRVKPTGRAYVCIGAYPDEILAYLTADRAGMELADILVWTYRNTIGPQPEQEYKQNWQAILHFRGIDSPPLRCASLTEQFSVQDINAPDGRLGDRFHAWQKPLELGERLVRHATEEGQTVIDPFAGTGTFLLAAGKLGRVAIGCDCDPKMIATAVERGCVLAG